MTHHLNIMANMGGPVAIGLAGIAAYGAFTPGEIVGPAASAMIPSTDIVLTGASVAIFSSLLAVIVTALSVVFRLLLVAKNDQIKDQATRLAVLNVSHQALNDRVTGMLEGTLRDVRDALRDLRTDDQANSAAQRAAIVQQSDDHRRIYDLLAQVGSDRRRPLHFPDPPPPSVGT